MGTVVAIPPPSLVDSAVRDTVRELLDTSGFADTRLRAMLGVKSVAEAASMDGRLIERRLADWPGLATLVCLFVAATRVPAARVVDALGAAAVNALRRAGLLDGEQALEATVRLLPVDGLLIASDRLQQHHEGAADFVLGPGPATRALTRLLIRRRCEAALDLGCGSGYIACLMAGFARQVVATDINPRAIAFTRFNLALNALDNVECRQGDLFDAVGTRRFDLIACNPPYVISPASTYTYRDGGPGICQAIVARAGAHLRPSGTLQMSCNWAHRRGRNWRDDLAAWFDRDRFGIWVLAGQSLDAASYATVWLQQQKLEPGRLDTEIKRWMAFYERESIESVGTGFVTLRPSANGWFEVRDLPGIAGLAGESVATAMIARELIADRQRQHGLLDARLVPAPGLERVERCRLHGSGWQRKSLELRCTEGLGFAARIDPVASRLLTALDGETTLRQAATRLATRMDLSPSIFIGGLEGLARRLLELGILVAVENP